MREQDLLRRLGLQIRAYRKAANLTLEQLATKLGVSYRTVSDIERGLQFTSLGNLYQISKAVGCDLPDLFAWASTRKSSDTEPLHRSIERMADEIGSLRSAVTPARQRRARKA